MTKRIDIGLLTCKEFPDAQSDYWPVRDELIGRGYSVEPIIWNEDNENLAAASNLIFCSVWDYHQNYDYFRDWLTKIEKVSNLINPPEIIRWNIDKTYLKHFEKNGIPVIETVWLETAALEKLAWQDVIIKPAVGAGSLGMKRFNLKNQAAEALEHVERLLKNCSVMVQPYLPSADLEGETALIYFDGKYSHAITRPLAGHHAEPDEEVAGASPVEPESKHLEIGQKVLDCLPYTPAYMRLDFLRGEQGEALVLEVEMVEPSLFIASDPGARKNYADALEKSFLKGKS